ncbi:MAG: DUF5703 family protein [Austwickia sp.]|nr:DUF5703 family protein [Actinomycetota bacterium]MCB1254176.1 hypothetical protein [Austwickia sp.]MCO5308137.1 DUF5703 family protein [Austwickia sp.]
MMEFEYRVVTFGRQVSREESRRALADAAEHDGWELARTRLYVGGARRVWLRRRIVRVPRRWVDAARA